MFRWLALAILVTAVSTSGYHRRKAREEGGTIARSLEGLPLMLGRLIVALPLFGSVVVFAINPDWMAWAAVSLPGAVRWLGVALGLLSILSVHWTLKTLGRNVSETVLTKEHHELVTAGPYNWVRHPLYATAIGLFLALGLIAANSFILLWALVALAAIRAFVVPLEERELAARFGQPYERYRARVGARLPF